MKAKHRRDKPPPRPRPALPIPDRSLPAPDSPAFPGAAHALTGGPVDGGPSEPVLASAFPLTCARIRSISAGSSMLAMTCRDAPMPRAHGCAGAATRTALPQRAQLSTSMPKTRFSRGRSAARRRGAARTRRPGRAGRAPTHRELVRESPEGQSPEERRIAAALSAAGVLPATRPQILRLLSLASVVMPSFGAETSIEISGPVGRQ